MIKFLKRMVIWLGYLSYSGSRRYVKYEKLSNTEKGLEKKKERELVLLREW